MGNNLAQSLSNLVQGAKIKTFKDKVNIMSAFNNWRTKLQMLEI